LWRPQPVHLLPSWQRGGGQAWRGQSSSVTARASGAACGDSAGRSDGRGGRGGEEGRQEEGETGEGRLNSDRMSVVRVISAVAGCCGLFLAVNAAAWYALRYVLRLLLISLMVGAWNDIYFLNVNKTRAASRRNCSALPHTALPSNLRLATSAAALVRGGARRMAVTATPPRVAAARRAAARGA